MAAESFHMFDIHETCDMDDLAEFWDVMQHTTPGPWAPPDLWQGEELDHVWFDDEPTEMACHVSEQLFLQRSDGITFCFMTGGSE